MRVSMTINAAECSFEIQPDDVLLDVLRREGYLEVKGSCHAGDCGACTVLLDGYPVVWTDVLEPYGVAAAADKPLAVFGALSFWWMGEHGAPRMDTSEHVWFANDQLAVRFIEEIDFDYMAADAAGALLTAAA